MTIQTENLIIPAHLPRHLRALVESVERFESVTGLRVAPGIREQLLSASSEFLTKLTEARQSDPWRWGFGAIHKRDNTLIGMGGFAHLPDTDGVAEIAYGIAPSYQGKGYATELAGVLIEFATSDPRVGTIRAHTLPERNASTRILEKCGFVKIGDAIDPENDLAVWRWEKAVLSRTK